jgi:DNA-binding beta-propeller fold protein YncE
MGLNPQAAVLDPATHTLYADDAPENATDGEVYVINASTCNALQSSGCGINNMPELQVGYRPVTIAVDQATDTIYVVNSAGNTVSVINGVTCNAQNTAGCGQMPPTVKVGSNPVDVSLDQATDTVYVANRGNGKGTTVSVIDGRTCNGQVTSGCGKIPATATIGTAPAGVVVDEAADTVYAGTVAPSGAEAVWVIDGATCNATTTSGCARTPHAARAGSGPDGIALNLATDTLYASNVTGDTVSVLDAATCNATVGSGCGTQPSRSLPTGQAPQWVTVDQATDALYVPNGDAGTMSMLNGATCNATVTSGCN